MLFVMIGKETEWLAVCLYRFMHSCDMIYALSEWMKRECVFVVANEEFLTVSTDKLNGVRPRGHRFECSTELRLAMVVNAFAKIKWYHLVVNRCADFDTRAWSLKSIFWVIPNVTSRWRSRNYGYNSEFRRNDLKQSSGKSKRYEISLGENIIWYFLHSVKFKRHNLNDFKNTRSKSAKSIRWRKLY